MKGAHYWELTVYALVVVPDRKLNIILSCIQLYQCVYCQTLIKGWAHMHIVHIDGPYEVYIGALPLTAAWQLLQGSKHNDAI